MDIVSEQPSVIMPAVTAYENVPLARYTSWRVGGPADRLIKPDNIENLAKVLQALPSEEPITFLGLGSNCLIRDGGIRGTVVVTQGGLSDLSHQHELVYCEAGVSCASVARYCARNHLVGGEFLAGIPGTMGGALAMNAGAFGGETWELVDSVLTVDKLGRLTWRQPKEFVVGYRSVFGLKSEWFVGAKLRLQKGDAEFSMDKIKQLLERRRMTQPINLPNCGSVFRNPDDDHAARLIECCGLKGYSRDGVRVSEKHANFIVHDGDGTASAIEAMIEYVADCVQSQHGVALKREVHLLGEKND